MGKLRGGAARRQRHTALRDGRVKTLLKIQDGKCAYCETPLTKDTATIDHRLPRSKGGGDEMNNLCLACADCNVAKGSMLEADFRKQLEAQL